MYRFVMYSDGDIKVNEVFHDGNLTAYQWAQIVFYRTIGELVAKAGYVLDWVRPDEAAALDGEHRVALYMEAI